MTHIISTSFNLLVESVLVLVPEWRISHQEDVEDHTYTPTHTKNTQTYTLVSVMTEMTNSYTITSH